jgi:hypothetical protein
LSWYGVPASAGLGRGAQQIADATAELSIFTGFSRIIAVEFDTFRTSTALDAEPRLVCCCQSCNLLVMKLNCNAVQDWRCKLLINRKLLKNELHRYGFSRDSIPGRGLRSDLWFKFQL